MVRVNLGADWSSNGRVGRTRSTFAGTGEDREDGDDGPAAQAAVRPFRLAVDAQDNLLIGSRVHIRRVRTDGVIEAVAGYGSGGDLGPALDARIRTSGW